MTLTLYYHPLSSFCHKALIALYENGTDFEKRIIDLGNAHDRAELQALWPLCKFPVIHDHVRNRNVAETTIIIEYLDKYFAGQRPLIPHNGDEALAVRLWDRVFDNYVQAPMQQIVGDRIRQANGDLGAARATLGTAYEMINSQLASKTWIVGDDFSMADCAAAPALFYASTVQPWSGEFGCLQAYFDRLMDRPSCRRVMAEARPYFSMYPFADAIAQRFR